ncbi:unnamed protein product [Zymoseptoria tritici ST99CH_3D7]|uniref:Uncharacterized protein n=1 Tax=Zymoseptoria tritici (strain ST99CH_3D7) TaxID=1276538 RepID=A0A1X7S9U3_ZYMT9|nr:unnamed protein product [Zymoseptoria tritici ST99CH_3D7]
MRTFIRRWLKWGDRCRGIHCLVGVDSTDSCLEFEKPQSAASSDDEITIGDDGKIREIIKKKKSKTFLKNNLPYHVCCHQYPTWTMAQCTTCDRAWCFGFLFCGWDGMAIEIVEGSSEKLRQRLSIRSSHNGSNGVTTSTITPLRSLHSANETFAEILEEDLHQRQRSGSKEVWPRIQSIRLLHSIPTRSRPEC